MIDTFLRWRPAAASQRGDTLIEVLISSLVVALIAVGTLIGFSATEGYSAQEREHNEAAALADQSQEQLRSDPASALETLGSAGHAYTQTVGGTTYTITQKAELLPANGSNGTCSVTATKRQSGNAFSITSTVTWHLQEAQHRNPVLASSIITPPTGSALEIDADNAPVATSGVAGVTALVTYTPVESKSSTSVQQTTGAEGCVVFGGIPATSAQVEIMETPGYVTVSGARKYPTKEVTIAPNYTTHYEVVYNQGGAITAKFEYEKKPEYKHQNNAGKEITEAVTGDTFVALNTKMKLSPEFEVGSTRYGAGSGELYEPLPAAVETPSPYQSTATSEKDLFPFTESENGYWSVFAGDCAANDPETLSGGVKLTEKVVVPPGGTFTAQVPMTYLELNVYKGSTTAEFETTKHPVTITNVACKEITPDNEVKFNEPKHKQETTSGAEDGGHLEHPFQPFGEARLCLANNNGSGTHYTYTTAYKLEAEERYPRNIFLGKTSEYTEKVKREPSGKEEEAKVTVASTSGTATCS